MIINDLKNSPKITLNKSELIFGHENLSFVNCVICKGIPIAPILQCDKCDAVFCQQCIESQTFKFSTGKAIKCPECKRAIY